jgi:hypothetical protein
MAAKKRSKKKPATPFGRVVKVGGGVAAMVAVLTLFATNLDKLGELWRKYLSPKPIAALHSPRNLPRDLFGSVAPVRAELVQASDEGVNGRAYDLYLENSGSKDVLLSEIRFGPGVAYASTAETSGMSEPVLPTASYRVVASTRRGTVPLSPPYRLGGTRNGAIRVVMESPPGGAASRGTMAFELYSASGEKVASVNRMLGE